MKTVLLLACCDATLIYLTLTLQPVQAQSFNYRDAHVGQRFVKSTNGIEVWYDNQAWHGENNRYHLFNASGRHATVDYIVDGSQREMVIAPGQERDVRFDGCHCQEVTVTDVKFDNW